MKSEFCAKYVIPARVFNALRVSVAGKGSAVRESMLLRQDGFNRQLARAEKRIAEAGERGAAHHQRRRLANLQHRLAGLEVEIAAGRIRRCFGSKKLWRKPQHLAGNGYQSHEDWKKDWREARSDEFFVLGSRDETAGCQLCVASVADDGSLRLRLRLPDCLGEQHGKYLTIEGVRFAYGHDQVLAALQGNAEFVSCRRQHGEKAARATGLGQAISYRFKRDHKGWRVFATTKMMAVAVVTDQRRGVVGVDLNADHLAVCDTDASGDYVHAFKVPLVT